MVPSKILRWVLFLVMVVFGTACQAEMAQETPTTVPQPSPGVTVMPKATDTLVLPAATPTENPTPTPTAEVRYRGLITLDQGRYAAIDFNGVGLGFEAPSPGDEINPTVFRDGIVYTRYSDLHVTVITQAGTQVLDFIPVDDYTMVSVNPQGTLIAWTNVSWAVAEAPAPVVMLAGVDGSNQREVARIEPTANRNRWLVFALPGWTRDGRLLIATQPTGIGGYILYGGWNGMRLYDPVSGQTSVLVDDAEGLMISLDAISDDLTKAAIAGGKMRVRDLATKVEITFPTLPDQNICGSGRFSPSGEWLAYACARMNPEQEAGEVMVAPSDGSVTPAVIYHEDQGAPRVLGWIDEQTLLFQTDNPADGNPVIWKVRRDGTDLTQIARGRFIGFIGP